MIVLTVELGGVIRAARTNRGTEQHIAEDYVDSNRECIVPLEWDRPHDSIGTRTTVVAVCCLLT